MVTEPILSYSEYGGEAQAVAETDKGPENLGNSLAKTAKAETKAESASKQAHENCALIQENTEAIAALKRVADTAAADRAAAANSEALDHPDTFSHAEAAEAIARHREKSYYFAGVLDYARRAKYPSAWIAALRADLELARLRYLVAHQTALAACVARYQACQQLLAIGEPAIFTPETGRSAELIQAAHRHHRAYRDSSDAHKSELTRMAELGLGEPTTEGN